jgi:hypothetical protein
MLIFRLINFMKKPASHFISEKPQPSIFKRHFRVEFGKRLALTAGLITFGFLTNLTAHAQTRTLPLPLEVLGNGDPTQPAIAGLTLAVPASRAARVTKLSIQCHRCGFYEAPAFQTLVKPLTKIKASVRVLGSAAPDSNVPWTDISDQNIELDPMVKAVGGINGSMVLSRFSIVLDAQTRSRIVARPAEVVVQFRFNGTDGHSNGYRVLDAKLTDASGVDLSKMPKSWASISAEKAAGNAASPADVAAGGALWRAQGLLNEAPIFRKTLRASCASCHSPDGRDLQYFNYSNNSIVQRSRYHGLSTQQGQQIAAYLRKSLYRSVPDVVAAAPWNPPYQPGAGLDAKPVQEWAAGAGAAAIISDPQLAAKALFRKPQDKTPLAITQADVDGVMNLKTSMNVRQTAVALEFPDWNAWLPHIHPLDVWTPEAGQAKGLFEQVDANGFNPVLAIQRAVSGLQQWRNPNGVYGDYSHLSPGQRASMASWLYHAVNYTPDFGGGNRGTRQSADPAKPFGGEIGGRKLQALADPATTSQFDAKNFTTQAFIERALVGLFHWNTVQVWDMAHRYGLESNQPQFSGSIDPSTGQWKGEGAARGWFYSPMTVFALAPHIAHAPDHTKNPRRDNYFAWETPLPSAYRTNQWYQLQMTLNPGLPGASRGPMDWPYQLTFIEGLAIYLREANADPKLIAMHLLRNIQTRVKQAQVANTKIPFNQPDPRAPNELFLNTGLQSKADLLFKISPTGLLPKKLTEPEANFFATFDALMPGLHRMILNGNISLYNDFFDGANPAAFRRCDPNNLTLGPPEHQSGHRFCVDAGRKPLPMDAPGRQYLPWSSDTWTTEQHGTWGVIAATAFGADAARVAKWNAFNLSIWPAEQSIETLHTPLGGWLISAPSCAEVNRATGRLDCVGVGADGVLYAQSRIDGQWRGWARLGGSFTADQTPSCFSWGLDSVGCYARGTDGQMWSAATHQGGNWVLSPMGGALAAAPSCVSGPVGKVLCAVRGADGLIYKMYYNGSAWSSWQFVGGGKATSNPSCAGGASGNFNCFWRGANGDLQQVFLPNGNVVEAPYTLGGFLVGDPACVRDARDQPVCYVRGGDSSLYQQRWVPGTGWSGWWHVGGTQGMLATSPACTASVMGPGTQCTFVSSDGRMRSLSSMSGGLAGASDLQWRDLAAGAWLEAPVCLQRGAKGERVDCTYRRSVDRTPSALSWGLR